MRHILIYLMLLLLAVPQAFADEKISNCERLQEALMIGNRATMNEKLDSWGGCEETSNECSTHIENLNVLREREAIQRVDGKPIRLEQHAPDDSKYLPEMDWNPLAGYKVISAGKRWGTCLEFSHTGIGKSGRYQRWTSVVLIPWEGSQPGLIAHRFVGYWAYCASLAEGEREGEVMLPIIEPINIGYGPLQLVWYHCNTERCTKIKDKRIVSGDSNSESGELVIKEVPKTTRNK